MIVRVDETGEEVITGDVGIVRGAGAVDHGVPQNSASDLQHAEPIHLPHAADLALPAG